MKKCRQPPLLVNVTINYPYENLGREYCLIIWTLLGMVGLSRVNKVQSVFDLLFVSLTRGDEDTTRSFITSSTENGTKDRREASWLFMCIQLDTHHFNLFEIWNREYKCEYQKSCVSFSSDLILTLKKKTQLKPFLQEHTYQTRDNSMWSFSSFS